MSRRPKAELSQQASLFELEKPSEPASQLNTDRLFTLPGISLGTSSFTATGWEGSFYPQGMRSRDFLSYYAKQFQTVEIDSTFYGTPSASTVASWNEKTPPDFIFAVKVPQVVPKLATSLPPHSLSLENESWPSCLLFGPCLAGH